MSLSKPAAPMILGLVLALAGSASAADSPLTPTSPLRFGRVEQQAEGWLKLVLHSYRKTEQQITETVIRNVQVEKTVVVDGRPKKITEVHQVPEQRVRKIQVEMPAPVAISLKQDEFEFYRMDGRRVDSIAPDKAARRKATRWPDSFRQYRDWTPAIVQLPGDPKLDVWHRRLFRPDALVVVVKRLPNRRNPIPHTKLQFGSARKGDENSLQLALNSTETRNVAQQFTVYKEVTEKRVVVRNGRRETVEVKRKVPVTESKIVSQTVLVPKKQTVRKGRYSLWLAKSDGEVVAIPDSAALADWRACIIAQDNARALIDWGVKCWSDGLFKPDTLVVGLFEAPAPVPDATDGSPPNPVVLVIFTKFDANSDGEISKTECEGSPYAADFERWDANQNGGLSHEELAIRQLSQKPARMLPIPSVDDLPRVSRGNPPSRAAKRNSAFVLATSEHPVQGDTYFVLTDHRDDGYLDPLRRLVEHRDGAMILVDDLASLHENERAFRRVRRQLVRGQARWVAIAPRLESYRENMLLGMWKLLSTIDGDPQIDVYPGVLMATNARSFAALIDQSIKNKPKSVRTLRPAAISQVQHGGELRSLQKAGILRRMFTEKHDVSTMVLGVYGPRAENAPKLKQSINTRLARDGEFATTLRDPGPSFLKACNLMIMHGHGVPGMSCSLDSAGLPAKMTGKILIAGSCFSAVPMQSDLPSMRQAPGGYAVQKRGAFALEAIDRGALLALGHQRLSFGFPHVYPVLQGLLDGKCAGAAYQEMLNGLIDLRGFGPDDFVIDPGLRPGNGPPRQNVLLYALIGDPALQPIAP